MSRLESDRLRLRQWQAADLPAFAEMGADPVVMEHFPARLDRERSDALALRFKAMIDDRGWGVWALERKAGGEFIGFVGLNIPSDELPFSPCVEIAWRLAQGYWHQGYASEAARVALRFGFVELDLEEIVAFTSLGNLRSQAVMARLGMRRSPENFQHPALPEGHPLREHCLYRLARGEWRAFPSR
ncbi:MAG: GNAT family N-acetyltransferase [Propionivibrio sp.]